MVGKITRNDLMTTSRLPSLFAVNGFESQNDLMADIKAERGHEGFTKREYEAGEPAFWGNQVEPLILAEAARRMGIDKYDTEITEVFRYRENFLESSLDGIFDASNLFDSTRVYASENIILENGKPFIDLVGKGAAEAKATQAPFTVVPPLYRGVLQNQGQMLCTGFKWGVIATLYSGNRLVLYIFEANKKTQDEIIERCEDFYSRLDAPDWYPIFNGEDGARTYNVAEGDLPEVSLENVSDIAEELVQVKKTRKVLENQQSVLEAQIMDEMGNHETAYLNDDSGERVLEISWKMRRTKAQPEKVVPAKPEKIERQKTLTINPRWLK